MATVSIDYDDGTSAHWTVPDVLVENQLEPILGNPEGIRC